MAEWKQTLEPYIKVQERVMTAALNPTVGEDLIVGVTFISDAGPSNPTLITSQKEFLKTYASSEITADYLASLDDLYIGDGTSDTASTMWANAYRLAGSTNLLCVRASKADNLYVAKPLDTDPGQNMFMLKDGELLKRVPEFKIVVDKTGDESIDHNDDGWSISVRDVGVFGNRVTDEGAAYDYYATDLIDLVDKLNETSKFFSPDFKFYKDARCQTEWKENEEPGLAIAVKFTEVYLAPNFIDDDEDLETNQKKKGLWYLLPCHSDWSEENPYQNVIDLNDSSNSGFEASEYFALNVYNSSSPLKVRIRRFNHDAVSSSTSFTTPKDLEANGKSPYIVLSEVLNTFTKKGTESPSATVLKRDFFEVAVLDPSINEEVSFFNIGNIAGRGDMEVSELNSLLNMISLNLPDDLHDLGLNYYDYKIVDNPGNDSDVTDEYIWKLVDQAEVVGNPNETYTTVADMVADTNVSPGAFAHIGDKYYKYVENGRDQVFIDLAINSDESAVLKIADSQLLKAMDKIQENEVYVVEGLCDLGNTNLSFQNYLANMSMSEDGNYFYPISTVRSTNYMTIGNSASKISADSYKLYMSAPWDIDTSTLGFRFAASPSVLYWEGVAANYRAGRPYASLFGQTYGKVGYQRPECEFNKRQRQLLLSKKVNTVKWNTNLQIWQMNDNYTKQSENTIMNDEGNVRMGIHIAKAQPQLLAQFIGKKITDRLCADVRGVIEYWIKTNIMTLDGNKPEEVQVFCDYDADLARQNKIKVVINVRFSRALKFVNVVNRYFDTGMDISGAE